MLQLWCNILECHRSPDSPEVLRMACAEALCVAGVPVMSLRDHSKAIAKRCEQWLCQQIKKSEEQKIRMV